jgi:AmmeMemoRadiSam system protein B
MLPCKVVGMSVSVRLPAVAGRFYPDNPEQLRQELLQYTQPAGERLAAIGCIVPHAGYMYSGHVAGAVFARLLLPRRYIILCPNHTGMGQPLAVMSSGVWETPLGDAHIDEELASALKAEFPSLREGAEAHLHEHALEVQIPFLQTLVPDFSFVPITIGVSRFDVLEQLGNSIADVLEREKEPVLLVASSDMNHYESDEVTRIKDRRALDRILDLDPRGLYDVVTRQQVSMCGFGPAIAVITAAKRRGANRAQLIKYATSGDVSGDRALVVGYAGVAVM